MVQQENARLKTGLSALSDRCRSAQTKIRSLNAMISRLKVDEGRLVAAVDKLYQLVSAQTGTTAALQASTSPLAGEINDLQAQTTALLQPAPAPPQSVVQTTALDSSSGESGP